MKFINTIILVILVFATAMSQVDTVSTNKTLPTFTHRPGIAAMECISTNVLINRYSAWISDLDWAKVTVDNWVDNIHTANSFIRKISINLN